MNDKSETEISAAPERTAPLGDPVFVKELRAQMLKFAILQTSDEQLAEDAVQEALVGALQNAGSFGRRAAFKTWVFAILKNKIADLLRQRQRLPETGGGLRAGDEEEDPGAFTARGRWQADERPRAWAHPLDSVQNEHFWRVFELCLDALPANQSRIFMMREFLELESTEICNIADISAGNLHVMLYRARLRLRKCLENRWFLEGERKK